MNVLVLLSALMATASASDVLVGSQVRSYALPSDPMMLPSSVAVDRDGRVYVADGVRRRVVAFGADGSLDHVITSVAGSKLDNPFALAVDADNALWIGDRTRLAIVPRTGAERSETLASFGQGAIDLTDIAISGGVTFLVDNDGHRLLREQSDAWTVIGQADLLHPFKVAVGADGAGFVSDSLHSRIEVYEPTGLIRQTIGTRGVDPGELYRPGGIVTVDDRVWVADNAFGIVQAFTTKGESLGVLYTTDSKVFTFDGPVDLDARAGHLYVVEAGAGRVVELKISTKSLGRAAAATAAASKPMDGCTTCHLEWANQDGALAEIVDKASHPDGKTFSGSMRACLSCHDGTVRDSRRAVWAQRGHPLGPVPADYTVPEKLPLVDGAIDCRTCHTAHSEGGSGAVRRDVLMLRVESDRNELCQACHPDVAKGKTGTHPVGTVGHTVIECEDCHVAHGASGASLLPAGAEDATCMTCHDLGPKHASGHPRTLPASAKLPKNVVLGDRGQMLCVTCHTTHEPVGVESACINCHGPAVKHGEPGVACASCHERSPAAPVMAGDPTGCLDCHDTGKPNAVAGMAPGRLGHLVDGLTHDGTTLVCAACHQPHRPAPPEACESCHVKQTERVDRGVGHASVGCETCHPAHADQPWTTATFPGFNPSSDPCLFCHTDGSETTPQIEAWQHEAQGGTDTTRWAPLDTLTLFGPDGQEAQGQMGGQLACLSCHYVHGPDADPALDHLRRDGWQEACSACHGQNAIVVYRYFHRPERRKKLLTGGDPMR